MREQLTEFIEQYIAMRKAERLHQKTRDSVDFVRYTKLQLQLDKAAPILLDVLKDDQSIKIQ